MKIANSAVCLSGRHSLVEKDESRESIQIWGRGRRLNGAAQILEQKRQDSVAVSRQAVSLMRQKLRQTENLAGREQVSLLSDEDKQKISLLEMLLSELTGKKIRFAVPAWNMSGGNAQSAGTGWGLSYESVQSHYEAETTSFQSHGIVKTADGKEISFSLNMTMSREFYSRQSVQIQAGAGAAVDPLVINYDGPSAGLTETKIQFDLDADGVLDNISFVRPGSGFLALDQNGDGVINDGRELFGPQSGDGFADLALYDVDGNQWIDENDPIFSQLQIWTRDSAGNDQLLALGVAGVGAIYLGHISTEFALKDSSNNHNGQVRSTGVFLRENGTAGTVQHVDLVV
ncbi:hypothetical protein [Acetonema longum]|uniref:VCBS repeat-containing protein n=1 Tax=Acetonema longum DSM 6540 TaxID=1009370 RepID=F7NNW8_9FIRM|nr:hypothetical protein [Acetonema longum]EGO62302.1 hypothetical protein ALO_19047 [Acetonema longum DSM 6540]